MSIGGREEKRTEKRGPSRRCGKAHVTKGREEERKTDEGWLSIGGRKRGERGEEKPVAAEREARVTKGRQRKENEERMKGGEERVDRFNEAYPGVLGISIGSSLLP